MIKTYSLSLLTLLFLTSCGGGGSSTTTTTCNASVSIDNSGNTQNGQGYIAASLIGAAKCENNNAITLSTTISKVFDVYAINNNIKGSLLRKVHFKSDGSYGVASSTPFTTFDYNVAFTYGVNKEGSYIKDENNDLANIDEPIFTNCFKIHSNNDTSNYQAFCF